MIDMRLFGKVEVKNEVISRKCFQRIEFIYHDDWKPKRKAPQKPIDDSPKKRGKYLKWLVSHGEMECAMCAYIMDVRAFHQRDRYNCGYMSQCIQCYRKWHRAARNKFKEA